MNAPNPCTSDRFRHIPGWGVDADPARRPGMPMDLGSSAQPAAAGAGSVPSITPQDQKVEVLQSTEHPQRPPVFGSTVPPRGLSGMIRRRAFRRSENDIRHWLLLIAADRVDVMEHALGRRRSAVGLGLAMAAVAASLLLVRGRRR